MQILDHRPLLCCLFLIFPEFAQQPGVFPAELLDLLAQGLDLRVRLRGARIQVVDGAISVHRLIGLRVVLKVLHGRINRLLGAWILFLRSVRSDARDGVLLLQLHGYSVRTF